MRSDTSYLSQIFEIVEAALQLPPKDRPSYLDAACQKPSLRKDVESLLLSHDEAGRFLDEPALAIYADVFSETDKAVWLGRQIGPYKLVEEIGEGGMGSVYRAVRADDQYQKQVAIKVVRAGFDSKSSLARFKAERQILANLEHPNIARLLDGGTTSEGLPFLVMELVEGHPIDQYCDEQELSLEERLNLFRTICSAVHYAHQSQVVHRDLKPSNMLVTAAGVPKLLDFGIAKILDPESFPQAVDRTATLMRMLTPEYASPEQVRGEAVTAASDVYSLGAVLYVLLTGQRPYSIKSGSLQEVAKTICEVEPTRPSNAVGGGAAARETDEKVRSADAKPDKPRERKTDNLRRRLTGDLDNIVLKALRKEPERRYSSVEEFSEDIQRHLSGLPVLARRDTVTYRASKFVRRNMPLVGSAGLLLLAASIGIGLITWQMRKSSRVPSDAVNQIHARPSVAVLGFKNLSGRSETAWLSTALSEMLSTELSAGETLRAIPGENIAQAKSDLSLVDAERYPGETLPRIRKTLGADVLVLGSYFDLGEGPGSEVRLDVSLQNAVTGEILTSMSVTGSESHLPELASRIGAGLRSKLGLPDITPAEATAVLAAIPANTAAARFYAEGLAKMRVFDALSARGLLEKAVAADPRYSLAHAALATAWIELGYEAKAADEGKRAVDLSSGLSREEHLSVEATYRETIHEWEKAIEIYKTLFAFFPDNLDYGLGLVRSQALGGQGKAAQSTAEALRRLPLPVREDPRIDLAEASAAHVVADYRHMQTAAAVAEQKGRTRGTRLIVARALYDEAVALGDIGNPKDAIAKSEEAKSIFLDSGNRSGAASALNMLGNILADTGDTARAKQAYREALQIDRETGNKKEIAGELGNIALMVGDTGDPAGARKLFEEALRTCREIGDKIGEADVLLNLANNRGQMGDLDGEVRMYRQSAAVARKIGYSADVASALNNLGVVLTSLGEMTPAKQAFEEALKMHRGSGQDRATVYPIEGLGDISFDTGNLSDATEKLQEALEVVHRTGEKSAESSVLADLGDVSFDGNHLSDAKNYYQRALESDNQSGYKPHANEVRIELAELALEEVHPAEAETLLRDAIKEFQVERLPDEEIVAHSVLARALLAQRKSADAGKEIGFGERLAKKSQNQVSRLRMAIATAQFLVAEGKFAAAKSLLETTLGQARKYEFVRYQYEARLALGEIELKTGMVQAGQARLEALEKEASAHGYGLIAKRVTL